MTHIVYIVSDIHKALAFEWIVQELDPSAFRLSFLLLQAGPSDLETFLRQKNIPVYRIACRSKKDWLPAWFKICRLLKRLKPDAVHCHLLTANVLGLSAAKLVGVPARYYTRHHSDFHFRYFSKGVKWDRLCNRWATRIIAPSRAVQEVLVSREAVPPGKITIIHHGFDLDYFDRVPADLLNTIRRKYNPDNRHPVIGVISRFTGLKGIQFIIPAFGKLLKHYPDAKLLLFNAQGDDRDKIHGLLAAQLPAASYQAVAFEPELAAVYKLFDVFVQASTDTHIEAFGQTYVEALAAGVPSVFTLAGIAADFVADGVNALVVPFKDSEAICQALLRLLQDKHLREQLQHEGRKSVQSMFDLRIMIRKLEQLYGSN